MFESYDPFGRPFTAAIGSRSLLYPTDGFILSQGQFNAVGAAARATTRDHSAILTLCEPASPTEELETWRISLADYPAYRRLRDTAPIVVENCLYSESGSWGVIVSQEFHALAGGAPAFIKALGESLPLPHRDLTEFLAYWSRSRKRINSDTSWIPPLLEHIFGKDEAGHLLAQWAVQEGASL